MKRIQIAMLPGVFVMLCALFLAESSALAQDAGALSRGIKQELRVAKNLMFKGKAQEAQVQIKLLSVKIEQLKSMDPKHSSLKGIVRDYERLEKDLARRLKQAPAASKTQKEAASKDAGDASDQLNAAAARYIRKMDEAIKGVERDLGRTTGTPQVRVKNARYSYGKVEMYWNDLNKKYPEALNHPEVMAAKGRMETILAQINAADKEAAQQMEKTAQAASAKAAESTAWADKLRPYVLVRGQANYVPGKEFIAGYTEDPKEMDQRMTLFAEASNLFAEYSRVKFSQGKTDELLDLEKKLAYKLETFQNELKMAADGYVAKAERAIGRCKENLAGNETRTKDGTTKPILINANTMEGILRDIAWAENLVPGDSRIQGLKKDFEDVKKEQSRWRAKMIESTSMLPHKFDGKESAALKDMATGIVKKKFSDAKILHVNVISTDWKEERALEYTDTTKTAIRYRITRSVSGQVAAKKGKDCFLYTVYMGKDRRSDGSWSPYRGHIMFTDPILEKNVPK
jgi:hypothetical protein